MSEEASSNDGGTLLPGRWCLHGHLEALRFRGLLALSSAPVCSQSRYLCDVCAASARWWPAVQCCAGDGTVGPARRVKLGGTVYPWEGHGDVLRGLQIGHGGRVCAGALL